VYIVYELMDTDLHQIIRSNQPLTDDHCQVCQCVQLRTRYASLIAAFWCLSMLKNLTFLEEFDITGKNM